MVELSYGVGPLLVTGVVAVWNVGAALVVMAVAESAEARSCSACRTWTGDFRP